MTAVAALLCMFAVLPLCASNMREKPTTVEIDGVIKIKGNEPFAKVFLETNDGRDYELTGPLVTELQFNYHLHRIRIKGEIESDSDDAGAYGSAKLRVTDYTDL